MHLLSYLKKQSPRKTKSSNSLEWGPNDYSKLDYRNRRSLVLGSLGANLFREIMHRRLKLKDQATGTGRNHQAA